MAAGPGRRRWRSGATMIAGRPGRRLRGTWRWTSRGIAGRGPSRPGGWRRRDGSRAGSPCGDGRGCGPCRAGRGWPTWEVEAKVSDLLASDRGRPVTLREPATLSARLARRAGGLAVEEMAVRTAFLDAKGRGDVDRGVAVSGTIDLGGLGQQLRE